MSKRYPPRMSRAQAPARRAIPAAFGVLTLISVGVLLARDAIPHLFAADPRDFVAALPLVLMATTHVVYRALRRGSPVEWAKTTLLALAFFFWATNLLCADRGLARLFNDVAIAAFILDAFLVIVDWPPGSTHGEGDLPELAKAGLSTEHSGALTSTVADGSG
jgi:hypothetical protein